MSDAVLIAIGIFGVCWSVFGACLAVELGWEREEGWECSQWRIAVVMALCGPFVWLFWVMVGSAIGIKTVAMRFAGKVSQ